jgi:Ethylbenzene dehydrogenase
MKFPKLRPLATCLVLWPALGLAADPPPQVVPVPALASAPKVDGDLSEWGTEGWIAIQVKPALERKDRPKYGLEEVDDYNVTGSLVVQLKVGTAGGRFYLAVKYPDATEDKEHQGWEWRDTKYVLVRRFDDQFAVRFHLAGDYDRSMLSAKEYKADVWLWTAARTNPGGIAEDLIHSFTTRLTEDAAEYSLPGGKTVYMKKQRDAGVAPFRNLPAPKEFKGDRLQSFELVKASGSVADVAAKGTWKSGWWSLEFSRAMNTGNSDDVAFKPGLKLLGQIAVFNRGQAEHKSVSEPLLFDFAAAP